jgi:DNA polymerase-3 subunit delta'
MSLLPWQRGLAERVEALIATARLPHGVLITAAEGWGEIAFAQWLALRLIELPQSAAAAEIAHPDLRWVKPDGAEIKVDAIREINGFAFTTSHSGGRKVVVLEDAHLLNRNAANALLKTLEEPPEDTFLVLASCHAGRLLPTIRSRCQRFAIQPDPDAARNWLAERWDDPEIEARWESSGGAPLLVAAELASASAPLEQTLAAIAGAKRPLECLADLLARDPDEVTGGWYRQIKALAARRLQPDGDVGTTPFPRQLFEFADELLWVRHQLLNTNSANARLLLGRLIVKWHGLLNQGGSQAG